MRTHTMPAGTVRTGGTRRGSAPGDPIPSRPGRRRARAAAIAAGSALIAAAVLVPSAAHAVDPAPANDSYSVGAGSLFTTAAGLGILANDLGIDAGALVEVTALPKFGTLSTIGAGGSFTYKPNDGFVGADVFTYCIKPLAGLVCLGGTATVTLQVDSVIERIGGADRYAVSAGVSRAKFDPMAAVAYVASGEVFPDALSASAAAGAQGGPVLLVSKDSVPTDVATELTRLKPQKIVVVGGLNTISATVETALKGYSGSVTRIAGADRYAVSAGISAGVFGEMRPIAYIASGEVFPDALSGSAAAGLKGGPVLLVTKDTVPAVVAAELTRLQPAKIVVLGGTNTVSDTVLAALPGTAKSRLGGADRFAVSVNVSAEAFKPADTHTVYVASGQVFPDALSGSAGAIKNKGPVLLVTKDGVPAAVGAELDRLDPTRIVVLGGTNTISDATYAELETHLAQSVR